RVGAWKIGGRHETSRPDGRDPAGRAKRLEPQPKPVPQLAHALKKLRVVDDIERRERGGRDERPAAEGRPVIAGLQRLGSRLAGAPRPSVKATGQDDDLAASTPLASELDRGLVRLGAGVREKDLRPRAE